MRLEEHIQTLLTHTTYDAGTHQIEVVTTPTGKPPLVLLHGANIGWGQWYKVIDALAQTHTVYMVNLPGAAGSSSVSYTRLDVYHDFVLPVASVLFDTLQLQNVSIVGHSIGGWIAAKLLESHSKQIRHALLVNSVGLKKSLSVQERLISFRPMMQFVTKIAMPLDAKHMRDFFLEGMYNTDAFEDTFLEYFLSQATNQPEGHPLAFTHGMTSRGRIRPELVFDSQDLHNSKIILAWGVHDPIIPLAEVMRTPAIDTYLNTRNIHMFDGSGHVPMIEEPAAFISFVQTTCPLHAS